MGFGDMGRDSCQGESSVVGVEDFESQLLVCGHPIRKLYIQDILEQQE
jgi:hypothetical protein